MRACWALTALMLAVLTWTEPADARAGGGSSFGSRGSRSFAAPPPTQTAPNSAAPLSRSMAPQAGQPSGATRPLSAGSNRPGLFGGFAAGFLGAGLLGLLLGHGLMGGLGGVASVLGLLFQIALVLMVGRLIWTWWQGRHAHAFAGLSPRQLADAYGRPRHESDLGGLAAADVAITDGDYDIFERLLGEIQSAYSREDLDALRERVTPEMLSYFAEDLARNRSRGVTNVLSDVRLLKGDLAEAWREGDLEYATVAMRFSLLDRVVERAGGQVVEGSDAEPTEATELWTFARSPGHSWLLSAIQQA